MSIAEKLLERRTDGRLTCIRFRGDRSTGLGYVLDIGPDFFLLAVVSDSICFDGFRCARFDQVVEIGREPDSNFVESALKLQGETMPPVPSISLQTTEELIASAGRAFPLISLRTVDSDPHCCWIGQVRGVSSTQVTLLEINPGADWEQKPSSFELGRITQIECGGDYAEALWLVGGKSMPPVANKR